MAAPYSATSTDPKVSALVGNNDGGYATQGISKTGVGVIGTSEGGIGVWGGSQTSSGVGGMTGSGYGTHGVSKTGHGAHGDSESDYGVVGTTTSPDPNKAAVWGENRNGAGIGVRGDSNSGIGVLGNSQSFRGVYGHSATNAGVVGESDGFDGVFGISHKATAAGVSGHNPGGLAGYFDGNVTVTGDVFVNGADCAEQFDLAGIGVGEPGTVMVMNSAGALIASTEPYDHKVVGVVSGAGEYKAAIILDRKEGGKRAAIALLGKVYCKVDADAAPIQTGDLMTTSGTTGHAMKAMDPAKAFGAVIGKALSPMQSGKGLLPLLIALQ